MWSFEEERGKWIKTKSPPLFLYFPTNDGRTGGVIKNASNT